MEVNIKIKDDPTHFCHPKRFVLMSSLVSSFYTSNLRQKSGIGPGSKLKVHVISSLHLKCPDRNGPRKGPAKQVVI